MSGESIRRWHVRIFFYLKYNLLLQRYRSLNSADDVAVFPEMKTALRTYHPVPSLQKTDGNLQDAPRIKNCLKAALLPSEAQGNPPTSLGDVIEKLVRRIFP